MAINESILLTRDCEVVAIPAGTKSTLPAGSEVIITQELGGNFTVMCPQGLVRIDEKNADALGKTASRPAAAATGEFNEELIWNQMKKCYDPEIPTNIVDLGLIYDCQVAVLPSGGRQVDIKMTLTAPGCGMGQVLADDVKNRVLEVPGVEEVNVELVWEPQWNQSMMSQAALLQLGML
jgi:probable FeS assembly SUF system protein SufT